MDNVFNYINYLFLNDKRESIYKRIYYDKMFYFTYGMYNIPWNEKTFSNLSWKLMYILNIPIECSVISIVYMKRLVVNGLVITEYNIRNIFTTCILLSYKFIIDKKIPLVLYSTVTTIPIRYLIKMESYIIKTLDYRLFIENVLYFQTLELIKIQ